MIKDVPLSATRSIKELVLDQEDFYRSFRMKCDFSQVIIPKRRKGFNRLIIVAKGMTAERVYNQCKKEFVCQQKFTNSVFDDERDPQNRAYAIWVRDVVEADEEHANKSANDIEREKLTTETLLERFLHGYKFYKETGRHLDVENVTLCAGSRGAGGIVPHVGWYDVELRVHLYSSDYVYDRLRSREVVS